MKITLRIAFEIIICRLQYFFRREVHDGIVDVKALQVMKSCTGHICWHWWTELLTKHSQLIFIAGNENFFFLGSQIVIFCISRLGMKESVIHTFQIFKKFIFTCFARAVAYAIYLALAATRWFVISSSSRNIQHFIWVLVANILFTSNLQRVQRPSVNSCRNYAILNKWKSPRNVNERVQGEMFTELSLFSFTIRLKTRIA